MNGGTSVWAITPEERGKHDKQFDTLGPVLGYISGEQARKFFLQSGSPPSVLAEIWNLADMDSDGKMDRSEFSIAMKLIKLTLQGRNLPSSLPITMKQHPTSNSGSNMSSSARFGMGSMPNSSVGSSSMPSISTMPILTPIPANLPLPSVQPSVPVPMNSPSITSLGNSGLPNGNVSLLTSPLVPSNAGTPMSGFSSPMAFSPSPGVSKANSLLDLGSSSSNSSSTTSSASNSPKIGSGDWAVPQASRLKYRQQFNTLDKLMSGYLSGPQVRNASMASNLTQTQSATIWSSADVDKDGQSRAEEFISAMHSVDMAKTGHPSPLTSPQDLIPPSLRGGINSNELVNGTGPYMSPSLIDTGEIEPAQKNKSNLSYEDKSKENFARGSAELEKRRQASEEEQRKERERRERVEREARESENRRRSEEERRSERQREMERQREEERSRESERKEAAKQEMERQRREEWERAKKEESGRRKEAEREEISRLRARKKSLELELEAVGNKHKQVSDCLRDAQSKRRIQKAEIDLINQKRDARIAEINTLQLEFEEWQRKSSQLVPEQQRSSEKSRNIALKKSPPTTLTSLTGSAAESSGNCRRLKGQSDISERETTDKSAQMEQYNKELKESREKQTQQQAILDDSHRVKEEKSRESQRRREEERERKRREEAEAARSAKLEEERIERERREREKREREEEEARQRRSQEEQRARQREEEEREAQARLQAAQEKAQEEERRRRDEEERKKRELEEEMRRKEMEEKREKEEQERGAAQLTSYRASYSFVARNADESSIDADCLIEVDEKTFGEPGWSFGNYQGKRGWFPHSYAEKCSASPTSEIPASSSGKTSSLPPLNARNSVVDATEDRTVSRFSQTSVLLAARAVSSWSPASETHLNPSSDMAGASSSFSQGDLISVSQQRDDWWLGQLNGTRGWFPKSYVTPEPGGNADVDTADSCDAVQLEEYVALYTYESPETGDLTFNEGDVIMVTEREGEWWRGCIGDQTGSFPSNYVRPVEPEASRPGVSSKKPEIVQAVTATEAPVAYQSTLSPGQSIVVRAKNSTGWWLGESQARGKKRQKGWFHSSHVKLSGPSSTKTSLSPSPVCQVIAMYDYTAANQDESSFSKGQLIKILDKTNPDWWKGEINGVTGSSPTNYVKMTTESDPSQQ